MKPLVNKLSIVTIKAFYLFILVMGSGTVIADKALIDPDAPVAATIGSVEFRHCALPYQGRERTVQCAWHTVSENPAEPNGTQIDLFVVRIPAKRESKDHLDPMLLIAGGPGQAASETYLYADQVWRALAKHRDFYLIDQRGTGNSALLECGDTLKSHSTVAQVYSSEQVIEKTAQCLQNLSGDPRYYTTDLTVEDYEQVRQALGVRQWNVLGVSYGTRVISHYMRRFPQSIRTAVMDSVIPPQHVVGEQIAIRSQQSLDSLFARCAAEEPCNTYFPDLEKNVTALFKQLEAAPVTAQVENLSTGGIEERRFTREELAMLVRLNLYHPNSVAILPPMLHQAVTQQYFSPLVRAAALVAKDLEQTMSYGLHHSVMCTEEYPFFALSAEDKRANEATFLGLSVINFIADVCSVWPQGDVPADMKAPLKSAIPTLLLSGEYDPITPPDYADQTLEHLQNARHLMLKGQGHFVSHVGCAPRVIEQFVDSQSVNDLDAACLERLSAAPLFLNYNGTAP